MTSVFVSESLNNSFTVTEPLKTLIVPGMIQVASSVSVFISHEIIQLTSLFKNSNSYKTNK